LVVISILGILFFLILPAIQSIRESARRTQCSSNLRQLGIALGAYEAQHGMFPPGYLEPMGRHPGLTVNYLSAFVRLLPHLEQQSTYSSINFDLHASDVPDWPILENSTSRNQQLSVLLCPSDREPNHANSYRFNAGRSRHDQPTLPYDGPFSTFVQPWPAAIRDGLSRTAFVSERIGGSFGQGGMDVSRDLKIPIAWPGKYLPNDDVFIKYCISVPAKGWNTFEGRYWYYWGAAYVFYNHNGRPNDPRPACGGDVFGLLSPKSQHNRCLHIIFGDGHLETIKDDINMMLWRSLGSCDGGD
jgi:hypothetical protein